MTQLNVITSLTSTCHLRHSFSDLAKMVHNTAAGPREKVGNDTPSRWLIPTELAGTVELDASSPRSRPA